MIKAIILFRRILSRPGKSTSRWVNILNTIKLHWNISVRGKAWIFNWQPPLRLIINKGDHSLTAQVYFGLSEQAEMSCLLKHLKPGSYFVDVGANLGVYTLLAAGVCEANVLAVEPWPSNVAVLRKQVEFNNLEAKVEILQAGASDQHGTLRFQSDSSQNTYVTATQNPVSKINTSIPGIRLDSILRRCPQYIKIDVEGHELQVLYGLGAYLDHPELEIVQCETLKGQRTNMLESVWKLMLDKGFIPCRFDSEEEELIEIKMGDRENTLFVRDGLNDYF